MDIAALATLFHDSDDPRNHREQIAVLRRAVVSLAQDVQVLRRALDEAGLLERDRYNAMRRQQMIGDHNTAGAAPWRRHSYFQHLIDEEEYLRTQMAASDEDVARYRSEVEFVTQLT